MESLMSSRVYLMPSRRKKILTLDMDPNSQKFVVVKTSHEVCYMMNGGLCFAPRDTYVVGYDRPRHRFHTAAHLVWVHLYL